ncbi:MAG: glycosyltransferase family 4 protein [Propionibacterium sp.]|nr:glycosyltransferase family 4 protein [Propionibacterium sp.]
MKVVLLAHSRFPVRAPFAGGLESFTWHLTRELRAHGIEVVLMAGPGSDTTLGAEELPVHAPQLSDLARADVSMPPGFQVHETMAYLHAMRVLAGRDDIDLIHNNSLHYLPISLAETVAQPVLTTLHSPPTPWLEPALALNPRAATVAVSRSVARMWHHVTDAKVIPNGIDLRAWPIGDGGSDLVWVGRIVPEKAPHLAAAVAHATGRALSFIGPVHDRDYFDRHLAPHLDDRVRYIGHLAPGDLQARLAGSAACLVTPAWDEPYGLVAAESMACGTPVLAVGRGGLPELVRPPGGCAVAPAEDDEGTVHRLVEALPRVLALDRRAVRRHAEKHCSLAVMTERYVAHYEQLVAGR